MTPEELDRIVSALLGGDWQRRLARQLDVNPTTVRRWVKGEAPIPEGVAAELRRILPRVPDEWILGDGIASRAEYLLHTQPPRFIGRMAYLDEGEQPSVNGIRLWLDSGLCLCDIVWLDADQVPTAEELEELVLRVRVALAADSHELEEEVEE